MSTWWLQIRDRDVFGNIEKHLFSVIVFIRVDLMQHGEILFSLMFVLFDFKAICVVWPWCRDYNTYFIFTLKMMQMKPAVQCFTDVGYRGLKHLVDQMSIFSDCFTSLDSLQPATAHLNTKLCAMHLNILFLQF